MDTTAATAVLTTFYPLLGDGRALYIGFAVIAVALVVLTRGRLGYRAEQSSAPEPSRLPATVTGAAREI